MVKRYRRVLYTNTQQYRPGSVDVGDLMPSASGLFETDCVSSSSSGSNSVVSMMVTGDSREWYIVVVVVV